MRVNRFFHNIDAGRFTRTVLLVVCLFFAVGMLAGLFLGKHISVTEKEELSDYIYKYAQICGQNDRPTASLLSIWSTYFRYPVCFFLLGWCVLGVVGVPILCFLQGFSLSFAVSTFVSVLGKSGIRLALYTFGLRCLITLPCSIWLAMWAFSNSRGILHRPRERRKRAHRQDWCASFGLCALLLLIGSFLEITITPKLLTATIAKLI